MRYLNAATVRDSLSMRDAIEAMERAFTGTSDAPMRSLVGPSLVMPGTLDDLMAVKVVSVVPGNPVGLVVVFGDDGTPMGIVDGPTLTAIRTGAVAGLATRLLAKPDAAVLAMLGAGAMAHDQIEAVKAVRPIERVIVWSRDLGKARDLAERAGAEAVADAAEAVSQADVISCATPATTPLFADLVAVPGAHINAVGAFTPEMAELSPALLNRAFVVVDDLAAAAAEAGDLIQADRSPDATLHQLLEDGVPAVDHDFTVFKSVGIAAQDVAAAGRALVNATRQGLGVDLD